MTQPRKPLIALLAAPETSASVLYGLYDVLCSVGAVYTDMTVGVPGDQLMDVRIASADGKPFHCIGDIPVTPHAALTDLRAPDAVVICDMYVPIHAAPEGRYPREREWLRAVHARGAIVGSVCSGTVLLAETGLLDGRVATAHWAYREMFRRHFPKVRLESESMLCLNEQADRIVTAGGVTAWHDLAVYLSARFCGQRQAIETAKVFLISGHAEGQSPYSVMTRPMETSDATISDCQAWIAANYAVPNPVERLVERSGLNARTFSRRFHLATGYAPIDYVQALRIEEAKQILETEDQPIDGIGKAIGYDDPASFRRVFKRRVGMSPAAYRKKFRSVVALARPGPFKTAGTS